MAAASGNPTPALTRGGKGHVMPAQQSEYYYSMTSFKVARRRRGMDLVLGLDEEVQGVFQRRPQVVILGAGCSLAAFPDGDRNGRRLPLMNNLIEILGLQDLVQRANLVDAPTNFEALYGRLADDPQQIGVVRDIESAVTDYFSQMVLPDSPTIYDHLMLGLRGKDCIATFNWDPFLWDARDRVQRLALSNDTPKLLFLHGNVRIGICYEHKIFGLVPGECPKCEKGFARSRLLFPVENKDYANDAFIEEQWKALRQYLNDAYILTIFGYGAPKSDAEAVGLMKQAWGKAADRNLEEIEIIDIRPGSELKKTWSSFIHTHHYRTVTDFYASWIADHPRRTCEVMWKQLMECRFAGKNAIPRSAGWSKLNTWFEPLFDAEMENREAEEDR
jgi:hypothetical protein